MRSHSDTKSIVALLVGTLAAAVLALTLLTADAGAAPNPGPGDGPQSANIPYVAWVGEHLRLVVCDPSINSNDQIGSLVSKGQSISRGVQFANFQVEDWSGYQFQPPTPDGEAGNSLGQIFDPGPAAFFSPSDPAHRYEGCVATDYKSLNPGLTRIRLVIRNEETGEIVFSHQFIAIWLTVNAPTLAEAGLSGNVNADGSAGDNVFQSQLNGTGQSNFAHFLGDPSGDGKFTPSPFYPQSWFNEEKGLVQIKVTGSFPVVKESPLSNILSQPSYTLPSDWRTLAETLASSSEELEPPGTNPGLWDIHGTPGEATTPNAGSSSNDPLHDVFFRPPFSSFTSGETATVGPFDPQAAEETLLSDGRLNPDDAPMPAMRIDVSIAANTGGSDLGGVGQISGAGKAQIYSHDFTGNAEEEGNLYNPYYGAYIPATDRPINEASGISGPSPGGNFPGFLNEHPGPYTFWTPVHSQGERFSSSTGCLRRAPGLATEASPENDYQTPSGPLSETFYTDERGEAYVTYTPGDGFFLNHIPSIATDANGGCDLESLFGKEIGHSSIDARAVYPYEPVDYPPVASARPLVKTVSSLWLKEVYEFPKGPTTADQSVRIVVAKAQDIDGHPFVGEVVCFHAQQESGVLQFTGSVVDTHGVLGQGEGATVDLGGTRAVPSPIPSENEFCETTNWQGLAAIELQNSSFSSVDLTTFYVNEGITRDNMIDFSTNPAGVREAEEKRHREEEAAEKRKHEEEAAAEKRRHEEEEAAARRHREEEAAAEKRKHEEEEAAARKQHEEQVAKEEAEKKTHEEIEAAKKKHEEEAAAEKRHHEEEEAATKRKHEEEAAAEKRKHEEEELAAKRKQLEEEEAERRRREEELTKAPAPAVAVPSLIAPLGPASAGPAGSPFGESPSSTTHATVAASHSHKRLKHHGKRSASGKHKRHHGGKHKK